MRIVHYNRPVSTTVKVYLPDDLPPFESYQFDQDTAHDRAILAAVNAELGDGVAIDVLDLDNDDEGEYAIVLISAPIAEMLKVIAGKTELGNLKATS